MVSPRSPLSQSMVAVAEGLLPPGHTRPLVPQVTPTRLQCSLELGFGGASSTLFLTPFPGARHFLPSLRKSPECAWCVERVQHELHET